MSRALLTGMSGTGKSSVVRELRRRGFTAIDMDEPGWSFLDADGQQLWHEDRLRDALGRDAAEQLIVSGCAASQVKFYPDFTHVILPLDQVVAAVLSIVAPDRAR